MLNCCDGVGDLVNRSFGDPVNRCVVDDPMICCDCVGVLMNCFDVVRDLMIYCNDVHEPVNRCVCYLFIRF
jgi:hypothetical protein